jgi:hypothetical protein
MILAAPFVVRDAFTTNAASPPVETEPATINPIVVKQNGHIVCLPSGEAVNAQPPLYRCRVRERDFYREEKKISRAV